MTTDTRLERNLPTILEDLYLGPTPTYRDEVMATAVRTRQRPSWSFPGRWIPLADIASRPAFAPRVPWRTIGLALVIIALLGALAVAFVGSRQQELPAPFGPAANGSVLYADGGDIYAADPRTGETTALVVGPETDLLPVWSPDGTRFAFERKVQGNAGLGRVYVSTADGRSIVQVTAEPVIGLTQWAFSPDSRSIVTVAYVDDAYAIVLLASDGSGGRSSFAVGATPDDGVPQFRPGGSEILFIGKEPSAAYRGVYGLDPASGSVRTIVAPFTNMDIHSAAWSPDGTRIAYGTWDEHAAGTVARTHVVSADGTGDVALDTDPERFADAGTIWSNDGTRLILTGYFHTTDGDVTRSVVVPADGSGPRVTVECLPGSPANDCSANWIWSPDDTQLLAAAPGGDGQPIGHFIADPITGAVRSAPWTGTGDPAWQRLALQP